MYSPPKWWSLRSRPHGRIQQRVLRAQGGRNNVHRCKPRRPSAGLLILTSSMYDVLRWDIKGEGYNDTSRIYIVITKMIQYQLVVLFQNDMVSSFVDMFFDVMSTLSFLLTATMQQWRAGRVRLYNIPWQLHPGHQKYQPHSGACIRGFL